MAVIARIDAVPTLLQVLCEITGMRFAMVARVTDKTWTACAVQDDLHLGLKAGCRSARCDVAFDSFQPPGPIVIERASSIRAIATKWRAEGLSDRELRLGANFSCRRTLFWQFVCARSKPAKVGEPHVVSTFTDLQRSSPSNSTSKCCKSESIPRCSMSAPQANCGSNSLRSWVTTYAILCTRYLPAAICWSESSPIQHCGHCARIKTNARRMSALIDDVLDFARGRSGGGIGVELTDVETSISA